MAALLGVPALLFGSVLWFPVFLAIGALILVGLFVLMCVGYAVGPVPRPPVS